MKPQPSIIGKFEALEKILQKANKLFSDLSEDVVGLRKTHLDRFKEVSSEVGFVKFDEETLEEFFKRPYVILPRKENEWYLIVPRFIDLQLGYLYRQTEAFNIFLVNRYIDWLYEIPEEVKVEIGFKSPPFKPIVEGDFVISKPEERDLILSRYKNHLLRREGEDKIRIKRGHHFRLICELIKDGILPFKPQPVDKDDLVDRSPTFELRDYQKDAWEDFLNLGNIGIYWAPAAGKMFFAMYAMSRTKGRKLIVVPTITLVEEWEKKIKDFTSIPSEEFDILCYASAHKAMKKDYILTIFDEHQHLPANTYAKLALIKTKYRIGTTATPWREDGRSEYIFALTGFPIGMEWRQLIEMGVITKPIIHLYVLKNLTAKFSVLNDLIEEDKRKTLVFCDSLNLGKQLSRKYNVPFVYSATRNRLEIIRNNPLCVCSRVGDEGIDIIDLHRVIEFDFLFGSRRQEAQRLGRVLHSQFKGLHIILMTEEEFNKYRKRLYSILEKGFHIERVG